MDDINYFKDFFESISDYRKTGLLMFLIKRDVGILYESGLLKNVINRLCLKFQKILTDKNEDYLDYIRNEEESFIEKNSIKRVNSLSGFF